MKDVFSEKEKDLSLLRVSSFIVLANWSSVKGRILIGSLSGANFTIRRAQIDHSRVRLPERIAYQIIAENKQVCC